MEYYFYKKHVQLPAMKENLKHIQVLALKENGKTNSLDLFFIDTVLLTLVVY